MAPKHKKNSKKTESGTIVGWVKTTSPKKGQHGKKSNVIRETIKEPYTKIWYEEEK